MAFIFVFTFTHSTAHAIHLTSIQCHRCHWVRAGFPNAPTGYGNTITHTYHHRRVAHIENKTTIRGRWHPINDRVQVLSDHTSVVCGACADGLTEIAIRQQRSGEVVVTRTIGLTVRSLTT